MLLTGARADTGEGGSALPISPELLRRRLAPLSSSPESALVLAVSGGSDSAALLRLAHAEPGLRARIRRVATVDHGLRPESAAEAAEVARWCADLGLAHETLTWTGAKSAGDLSAAARSARYGLLCGLALRLDADLLLAHTAEDQAETFLMNLTRGSGLEGLAAMRPRLERGGVAILRPMLAMERAKLRAWLTAQGAGWIEDPSNDDLRRLRPRLRQAAGLLEGFGLSRRRLLETIGHLARARDALEGLAEALQSEAARFGALGEARLARAPFAEAPREIALRGFAEILRQASGAEHPPRFAALERAFELWLAGGLAGGISLGGLLLRPEGADLLLLPEPGRLPAAAPLAPGETRLWAGRWLVALAPEAPQGVALGALGREGLAALKGAAREGWTPPDIWRSACVEARAALPAFRLEGALWAVPTLGWGAQTAKARLLERRASGR